LHSVLYKKTKCDRLYTILQKNGGTDTKAMGQKEPQFLSDTMSDRKKKFSPTLQKEVLELENTRFSKKKCM
jgi:hypothetical protein